MITCPKCSKDNQDHYKFCLGCGAELPRDAAPKPFSPQTPPQGMRAAQAAAPAPAAAAPPLAVAATAFASVAPQPRRAAAAPAVASQAPVAPPPAAPPPAATPAAAAPAAGTVICPQCSHVNSPTNMFCGSCGFRLGGAAPRAAAAPAPAPVEAPAAAGAILVLTALRADGTEAGTFQIPNAAGSIGRETGGIFAGDSYLSPRHATFRPAGPGRAFVKDENSLNGVYKKLGRDVPVEIKPNDIFRIGQEIIRFEPLTPQPAAPDGVERLGAPSTGYVGRIALVIGRDETGNAFPIPESGIHMGRERAATFSSQKTATSRVSTVPAQLGWTRQKLFLTDLGSSNGTFVRLTREADVRTGDVLLMGQKLFLGIAARVCAAGVVKAIAAMSTGVRSASLPRSSRRMAGISSHSAERPRSSRLMWSSRRARRGQRDGRSSPTARGSSSSWCGHRGGQAHLVRQPPVRSLRRRSLPLRVHAHERRPRGEERSRVQVGDERRVRPVPLHAGGRGVDEQASRRLGGGAGGPAGVDGAPRHGKEEGEEGEGEPLEAREGALAGDHSPAHAERLNAVREVI